MLAVGVHYRGERSTWASARRLVEGQEFGGLEMIRNGEISMFGVKRILRKFWWILPLTIISGGALGLGATMVLPKKFTSQSRVQIREQSLSPDIVKPVLTEATNQRVVLMQEDILSRTQLQAIIEQLGLYPGAREKVHMEDLVMKLRTAIEVTPPDAVLGVQSRQLPGFYINVTFDNPEIANRICSEITRRFMEKNATEITDKSRRAKEFLSQQAEEAKRTLDEQDARLAEFKKKYMGSLPDQQHANLSLLQTMDSQLEATTQAISRAQQDKAMNESLLSAQVGTWKATRRPAARHRKRSDNNSLRLQEQLSSLQSALYARTIPT